MQPDSLISRLWQRRVWLVPGLLVALLAAFAVHRNSAEFAAATTHVFVDFPDQSALLDIDRSVGPLVNHSSVYARLGPSPAVLGLIAEEAGVSASDIDARAPYNPNALRILREPTAERRAAQLQGESKKYRLRFDTEWDQGVPLVTIYAQAPTVPIARKLANAAAVGLRGYIQRVQERQELKDPAEVRLRQLGPADGAIVNPGVDRQVAVLVFLATIAAWSSLVLLLSNLRRFLAARRSGVAPPGPPGSVDVFDLNDPSLDRPYVGSNR
jgi:hypothetical protein